MNVLVVIQQWGDTPNAFLLCPDSQEEHLFLSAGLTEAWSRHVASYVYFRTRALLLPEDLM